MPIYQCSAAAGMLTSITADQTPKIGRDQGDE